MTKMIDISAMPAELSEKNTLTARRLGIDTHEHAVIYMRADCHICRAEGFNNHARIKVSGPSNKAIIATLNLVVTDLLSPGQIGLSETAWLRLQLNEGDPVRLIHPAPLLSLSAVRAKIFGEPLDQNNLDAIVGDIAAGRFSDIHLSAFLTASAAHEQSFEEIRDLTLSMVNVGQRLDWGRAPIVDKHCVGGLPGNRTTPIVVAICVAAGLTMPKTSSRAITSPAGTADTMETLAPVELDVSAMRRVVETVGGCIVWGGAVALSPVDDTLIRIERALDIDSDGQLVASVLSKKIAAGATHLVIDMHVGPTAKVRTEEAAARLEGLFARVGSNLGLNLKIMRTDGSQPVGRGIGPALEAWDVLAVLNNEGHNVPDLTVQATLLAGELLEMGQAAPAGRGAELATELLVNGRAWRAFEAICEAQGGFREPPTAPHYQVIQSPRDGVVGRIDNRRLAKAAKLAGAPASKAAGIVLHAKLGSQMVKGQPLYSLHSQSLGELSYAHDYLASQPEIIEIEEEQCPR